MRNSGSCITIYPRLGASKLQFGEEINQCIMLISKASKSVGKYSHIVDIMKNTQDPAKATANTKVGQKTSIPSRKHQAVLLGTKAKGSITQRNIRGKTFQFGCECHYSKSKKFNAGNIKVIVTYGRKLHQIISL